MEYPSRMCLFSCSKIHKYIMWFYFKSQSNGWKSKKNLKYENLSWNILRTLYIFHTHHFPKIRRTLLLNYLVGTSEGNVRNNANHHTLYLIIFFLQDCKAIQRRIFLVYSVRLKLYTLQCVYCCSVNKIKNVVPFRFLIFVLFFCTIV